MISDILYLISFLRKTHGNYFNILPNELLDYFIIPMTRWRCIGPSLGNDIVWENWVINPKCFTVGDYGHIYVYDAVVNTVNKIRYSSIRRINGEERVIWKITVSPDVISLDFNKSELKIIYNNRIENYSSDGKFKYISYDYVMKKPQTDLHNQQIIFRDGMISLMWKDKIIWRDVIIGRRLDDFQIDDVGNIFLLIWSNEDAIDKYVKKYVLYGFETWSSFINNKQIQYNMGQYI